MHVVYGFQPFLWARVRILSNLWKPRIQDVHLRRNRFLGDFGRPFGFFWIFLMHCTQFSEYYESLEAYLHMEGNMYGDVAVDVEAYVESV